ncbi:hypothetical protein BDK51DRAFT_44151 [Blyttiomyces helicus]|uniref:DUF7223 domain-containing protein n=1 Tax=Blyttiomyces helicus TaxID=388810 RepID=A0A4P9WHN9_9FUNG|nr:hypothetical protein BDK51DRAFT_44151 [Blyttiomyces helicus]|eukprot:RKO90056.1 hypothetical protein BDK51DRAFT_44151 [Blyttiomyces helicus]
MYPSSAFWTLCALIPNAVLTTPVPPHAGAPEHHSNPCSGGHCIKTLEHAVHTIFTPIKLHGEPLASKVVRAAYANPTDKNSQVHFVFKTEDFTVNLDNVPNLSRISCSTTDVLLRMDTQRDVDSALVAATAPGHAVLINGHWNCGSTDATWRKIIKRTFNKNVVILETGPQQDMSTFAADFEFNAINTAAAHGHTLSATKDINFELASDVNPLLISVENDLLDQLPERFKAERAKIPAIHCTKCSLTGKVTFSLTVIIVCRLVCGVPGVDDSKEASGRVGSEKPSISASIGGNLDGNFDVAITTPALAKHLAGVTVPVLTLPLTSFGIPGILSVGPSFDLDAGFSVDVAGGATINTGFDFQLPEFDTSITAHAALQKPQVDHSQFIRPIFKLHKPSLTGSVTLSASASLSPKLKIGVSLMGVGGINAGIGILNTIKATAKASSNEGTCRLPDVLVDLRATSDISAFVSFLEPIPIHKLLNRPLFLNNRCVAIPGLHSSSSGATGASPHHAAPSGKSIDPSTLHRSASSVHRPAVGTQRS